MTTDLRNLPDVVRTRLGDSLDDLAVNLRGGRIAEGVRFGADLRVDANGNPVLEGYALVYDHPYDVAGGPPHGFVETIARGAADESLRQRDDVRLLINHDGITLARTRSRTLELESDKTGLFARATLDGKSPTVQSLVSAMERGDMDEMSFAFKATRQEWNDDYTERRVLEFKTYDVSVVTYPANPATVVQLRTTAAPVERPGLAEAEQILAAIRALRTA